MSFSMETEKENKLSFLDVEFIREQGKFTTTVYRKPTFSGVYSNFESFLPSVYKFDMVYTLVYRCFRISSNWTQFHTELTFLKEIFRKNGYLENFIDKCFKKFLNNVHLVKENVPTVEKFFLNIKQSFPILSVTKTLYPKTLYLVLFINFSVVSAMSPIMVKVSDT